MCNLRPRLYCRDTEVKNTSLHSTVQTSLDMKRKVYYAKTLPSTHLRHSPHDRANTMDTPPVVSAARYTDKQLTRFEREKSHGHLSQINTHLE